MKSKIYDSLLLGIMLCCQSIMVVRAQLPQPSEWAQFVNGTQNELLLDTFRMQTFSHSARDNWNYQVEGNITERLFTMSETRMKEDHQGLQIGIPGFVTFAPYSLGQYQNVKITMFYGGSDLAKEDQLKISIFRGGNMSDVILRSGENGASCPYILQPLGKSPSYIKISAEGEKSSKGYFGLLQLFATGSIPTYSRFTGNGCWNDTVRWSHLPAARLRKALIEGNITVNENIGCDELYLSGSALQIAEKGKLQVRQLEVFDMQTTLSGVGELKIGESLILHYTFPEKGRWYFMSFPCDLYADELDSPFSLKDETPNGGGNYLYVREYDGVRRAEKNIASGNWMVVPASSKHTLLFKRGKGYLVALDEAAGSQEIVFKSKGKEKNETLLQSLSCSAVFPFSCTSDNIDNYGWQLFGNPFPSPLHFSDIKVSGFENCIYEYENGKYQRYPLTDDRLIPPYTPFFLKTEQGEASVSFAPAEKVLPLSPKQSVLRVYEGGKEPSVPLRPTSATEITPSVLLKVVGNRCYIDCQDQCGLCRIYNLIGSLMKEFPLQSGRNEFVWEAPSGCYLFDIKMGPKHWTQKVMIR